MKNLINTLRNIWKIEELKTRILYTLGILLVYRLGCHVILPGVDPQQLQALTAKTSDGVLGLLDMFSGGAFSKASIFALGIMPYISASIVVQLLGIAVPYFQRLQKEGESGRRKINQITRYLTVAILIVQAPAYLSQIPLEARLFDGALFKIASITILTAGTMFIMWLGEKITDKGIGNGISLIIMIGIIARMPFAFMGEFLAKIDNQGGGLVLFLVELLVLFLVFVVSILLVQGTRRIPVQYAKRIVGNKQYGGVRQYIPLKVNAAGVMPIIFAQALMFLPIMLASFDTSATTGIAAAFADYTGFWYNFTFGTMIILFTYFYTAITVNPTQMAEDMKRNGGFIPGVKPGKKTVEFLDSVMSRITLPGSIFLAFIAILPAIATLAGVNSQWAQFYGGTSLLILVGVVLDTLQQIESHLLMRHYDGLMKTGRIKENQECNSFHSSSLMIFIKTKEEIEIIRDNNMLVSRTLAEVAKCIAPGVTTKKLDAIAEEFIRDNGAIPGFLGYHGFPSTLCTSINDVVVHGIPSNNTLKDGDIISVDVGTKMNGFYGDSAYTFLVGEVSNDVKMLVQRTKKSLKKGVDQMIPGNRIGDIGHAIQKHVEGFGYSVVREMVGHGLGASMHEDPEVPNYGKAGRGPLLKEGMVLCVEPMINLGKKEIYQEDDGWTIRTRDSKQSAHFEYCIAVTKDGPDVLTTYDFIEEVLSKK